MTKKAQAWEVNFDGLVGPTHNYSGLSYGNVASTSHRSMASNPREAALQGLRKMKTLSDLGLRQAVLPPQERPDLEALRRLGFSGTETEILAKASKDAPELLAAVSSASCMWTANAATVSPSADSEDEKVHFTPANLVSKFHRSLESATTARVLRKIFENPRYFAHHDVLPSVPQFGDEGAANHTRLCPEYGARGVEFFVSAATLFDPAGKSLGVFPPGRHSKRPRRSPSFISSIPVRSSMRNRVLRRSMPGFFITMWSESGTKTFIFATKERFLTQRGS